jgi:hypothetical protein
MTGCSAISRRRQMASSCCVLSMREGQQQWKAKRNKRRNKHKLTTPAEYCSANHYECAAYLRKDRNSGSSRVPAPSTSNCAMAVLSTRSSTSTPNSPSSRDSSCWSSEPCKNHQTSSSLSARAGIYGFTGRYASSPIRPRRTRRTASRPARGPWRPARPASAPPSRAAAPCPCTAPSCSRSSAPA